MSNEFNLNTVEGQYNLQVKEFRDRTDRMKATTRKMWLLQEGFRESFEATWVDWEERPRRSLLKPCHERLDSSLPPPFPKSKALLELSCPELTDDRLITEKQIKTVEFIDLVVNDSENSEKNPLHKLIMSNISSFIKSVDGNVYPSFAGHRNRDKWTLSLLIEQRSMWVANFVLNIVAEMANIFHAVEAEETARKEAEAKAAEASSAPSPSSSSSPASPPVPGAQSLDTIDSTKCLSCGTAAVTLQTCGGCKKARFCDRDCQRAAWPKHKLVCKK